MNLYSIIAFIFAGMVFLFGALTATDNPSAYLDGHAALIVFGGTVAVAAISYQIDRIGLMLKVFFHRVLRGRKVDYVPVIREMMTLAEAYRKGSDSLGRLVASSKDPFIRECMEMLMEQYLGEDNLYRILKNRVETQYLRYSEDAKKFKALGKFPPAMGLMGAVLGMIALLQSIGQAQSEQNIGPAMAVALVATLYGVSFANLIVLPIAENLQESAKEVYLKNLIIVEGTRLIARRTNQVMLAEELNSYLLPAERIDWKASRVQKTA